ncbi:hypothetical protein DNTS_030208 [Danionella cerebrum]|uniref:UPAR/Ly6 domain-containing protein n=1 Tax=Danionella cerebrum TaxID=2873325 RepID=A0A553Q8A7_9TELE|nr:hypothetical protein DNTS_030208 [Danionella translucida]
MTRSNELCLCWPHLTTACDRSGCTSSASALLRYSVQSRVCVSLQIQCYQCEDSQNDCSAPQFIVNCTVNVQDMCQQEVLILEDGVHYRKSCASGAACLIASSGYQQFCTGRLNSVCISCCNTPLCNGARLRRRVSSRADSSTAASTVMMMMMMMMMMSYFLWL